MSAPSWISQANFYQIFPERFFNGNDALNPPQVVPWDSEPTYDNFFGGDLPGITAKMSYLEKLGINAIYLNPIFHARTNHRYDAIDYFKIDPCLGDETDFRNLLNEAHNRGIRIILDGVFNHCGNYHTAFVDVIKNEAQSKYVNWFMVEGFPVVSTPDNFNYRTCTGCYYLPKWNVYNPEVREHHLSVARYWLNKGIDGWRLDVPYLVNMNFWRQFHDTVKAFGDDKYLVAEEWRDPRIWLEPDLMDGVMNYTLRDLILAFCGDKSITAYDFAKGANELYENTPNEFRTSMLNLVGSHDTERIFTRAQHKTERVTQAYALLYSMQGAPILYYGDENGMSGKNDPGCRGGMVWDQTLWNLEIRDAVEGLIKSRIDSLCLQNGTQELVPIDVDTVMIKRRMQNRGSVSLVHRGEGRNVSSSEIPLREWRSIFGIPSVIGESFRLDNRHPLILEGAVDVQQW